MTFHEMIGFYLLCAVIAIVTVTAIWDALKKTRRVHNWLIQREKNKKKREKNKHRYLPYV